MQKVLVESTKFSLQSITKTFLNGVKLTKLIPNEFKIEKAESKLEKPKQKTKKTGKTEKTKFEDVEKAFQFKNKYSLPALKEFVL